MIPESFIEDILARTDVVDLIDGYVPLKKAGANYAACCPFHSEKTPSFTVSPDKQFFHCFGCGAHGTAIGFIMQYQGLSFVETIHELAGRMGLQVPETAWTNTQGAANDQTRGQIHKLSEIMAQAAQYYQRQLYNSPVAMAYLQQRGLGDTKAKEIISRFGIGYAPEAWQNLQAVFPDYASTDLQSAGLVIKNEQGRLYDRFRERLMFPIHNSKGEVIAFGGRIIGNDEPKYLNSPETPLFEKGRELFGLDKARQALRASDQVIVVEGYMDVVALAQHGIDNAVATLGTATTPVHLQKLLRQASRVTFCFDGDIAGQKAAWRALQNALDSIVDNKLIQFVFLPEKDDPDSYVRTHGKAGFERILREASPLSDFLINELEKRSAPSSAEGRARMLQEAKPMLQRIKAPAIRLQLAKRLAASTGFSQSEVERLCELRSFGRPPPARSRRQAPSLARSLLGLCVQNLSLARRIPVRLLDNSPEEQALALLVNTVMAGTGQADATAAVPSYAILIEKLRATPELAIIEQTASLQFSALLSAEELEAEFASALLKLAERDHQRNIAELHEKARQHGVAGLSAEEKKEYLRLLQAGKK